MTTNQIEYNSTSSSATWTDNNYTYGYPNYYGYGVYTNFPFEELMRLRDRVKDLETKLAKMDRILEAIKNVENEAPDKDV